MDLRITTLIASEDYSEALELIADAYGPAVLRYCVGVVGGRAEGEEAFQETLIQAFSALPRFTSVGTVRGWVFSIARRVCSRQLRRRDRRRSLWERFRPPTAAFQPADPVEQSQTRAAMSAALGALKPTLREAVLLRYQAELSGPEVALALGISHGAARKRVSLGLAALRAAMGPALDLDSARPELGPSTTGPHTEPHTEPLTPKEPADVALQASDRPRIVRS